MTGITNFHFLMRDLAHEVDAGRMTDIEAAGKVAESIQKALQCIHVTFWSVSGQVGQRVMRSVVSYDGARNLVVPGTAAFPESGGGFFGALVRDGCYVCGDTFADSALQSVREIMLVPFNIRALLAASYGGDGECGESSLAPTTSFANGAPPRSPRSEDARPKSRPCAPDAGYSATRSPQVAS